MTPDELIEMIAAADDNTQKEIYTRLANNGLTNEEINAIRNMVFFHKLYNDKEFYNSVVATLGNSLYNTLTA